MYVMLCYVMLNVVTIKSDDEPNLTMIN